MAESGHEFDRRFVWLPLGIVVLIVGVKLVGDLAWHQLAEESFKALVEALVGIGVVGTALSWDRDRRRARERKVEIVNEIASMQRAITYAIDLMETNQSTKTWKEQLIPLLRLRDRLESLRETMSSLDHDRYVTYAADFYPHIESVKTRLDALQRELRAKEKEMSKEQRTFQKRLEVEEDPDRERHWNTLLDMVPETKALVKGDGAALIAELQAAAHPVQLDLRARDYWLRRR